MDKETWTQLLVLATTVVLVAAAVGITRARPPKQVLVPFIPTLVLSGAIYTGIDGAESFHSDVIICSVVAAAFALFLVFFQPARSKLATFSWALLGVVTPYSLFLGLLFVACWNKTECLG